MNFKTERKRLHDACKKVIKATSNATKVAPELSGILLEADADSRTLKLTGTDLTVSMMMKLKDVDISESGSIVISAALFTNMLGAMTDETAEITVQDSTLILQCGNPKFRVPIMNAERFPNINIAFPETTICVTGLALFSKQNASIVSERNDRPEFQGVQMKFSPGVTTATSSDGVRIVKSKGDNIADGTLDLFIPERALKLLYGIVRAGDELYIGEVNKCAVFMTSEFVFATRLTNGNLNKIENLIKKIVPKYRAVVDAKEFLQAVDSCISMVYRVDSCVNVTLTNNSLVLSVNNENGNIEIEVDAEKSTDMQGKVFHYRPNYIYDFLRSCTGLVNVDFDEKGIMILRSDATEYVIPPRTPAKIKETKVTVKKGETRAEARQALPDGSPLDVKKEKKGKAAKIAA